MALSQVDVLIVVDVENALASQNLQDNVYLIDNNKNFGSGNEGQSELITACADGQIVTWNVTPVSPSTDVEISQFTGSMINDGICIPKQISGLNGPFWEGRVEARGSAGDVQYSVVLTMNGTSLTFDPFLRVNGN